QHLGKSKIHRQGNEHEARRCISAQYSTDDLLQLEPATVMSLLDRGRITRRDVFKVMSAAGVASFGLQMLDDSVLAKEELKMIIWEGYADDKYRIPFEEANDAT